jgi:hypothetical protein
MTIRNPKRKQNRRNKLVYFDPFYVSTTRPQALCTEITKAIRKHASKQSWGLKYEVEE